VRAAALGRRHSLSSDEGRGGGPFSSTETLPAYHLVAEDEDPRGQRHLLSPSALPEPPQSPAGPFCRVGELARCEADSGSDSDMLPLRPWKSDGHRLHTATEDQTVQRISCGFRRRSRRKSSAMRFLQQPEAVEGRGARVPAEASVFGVWEPLPQHSPLLGGLERVANETPPPSSRTAPKGRALGCSGQAAGAEGLPAAVSGSEPSSSASNGSLAHPDRSLPSGPSAASPVHPCWLDEGSGLFLPGSIVQVEASGGVPGTHERAKVLVVDHLEAIYKVRTDQGLTKTIKAKQARPLGPWFQRGDPTQVRGAWPSAQA